MEIVTGHRGTPHVTPYKVRDFNIGTVGAEDYVMAVGSELEAQLVSNNRIDIKDGSICMQGTHAVIPKNINDELTIENGTQGEKRIDLIVARYEKVADSGVESVNTVVLQGTPSKETPNVPGHVVGDIRNGDLKHEMPLYEVELDGINITEVRPVFKKLVSAAEQQKMIESLNGKITEQNTLWDGFLYMQGGQEVKLSTPIDQTKSGIVLVFSFVENEKAQDYAWHSFFVPKALVESRPGDGHQFNLFWNTWSQKYLYIHNDKIVGQPTNSNTQNKRFGLRKIIAV